MVPLAVPLCRNVGLVRDRATWRFAALLVGATAALFSGAAFGWAMGGRRGDLLALLPKSAAEAASMAIAPTLGGGTGPTAVSYGNRAGCDCTLRAQCTPCSGAECSRPRYGPGQLWHRHCPRISGARDHRDVLWPRDAAECRHHGLACAVANTPSLALTTPADPLGDGTPGRSDGGTLEHLREIRYIIGKAATGPFPGLSSLTLRHAGLAQW